MASEPPARTPEDLRARLLTLPGRLRRDAVDGLAAEWELHLGDDVFTLAVASRSCTVREGAGQDPAVRVSTDPATWFALDDGRESGIEAFLDRRLVVRGDLDLAVRLQMLFEPHGRDRVPADLEQLEVDADGLHLSAYVAGDPDAPVLLLLHGLGGSKVSWLPVVPALASRYRLVIPDLPGHGRSDKPRTSYPLRYHARAARLVLDAMGAERAAVAGNSLGGRVAIELALRSPGRVAALLLLDPAIPGFRVRPLLGLARVVPSELGRIPFPLRERWMQRYVRRLFGDPSVLPEEGYLAAADDFIRIYRDPAARMAFFDTLRHLVTESPRRFWGLMRRVRVPALVVWGTADRLVPVRLATRLAEALPVAETVLLDGVGHVPQFEAPDDVVREAIRFLDGVDPW